MLLRNKPGRDSNLEFYKQQYEKLLLAADLLLKQSYGDYIDEYEALTECFWSESDLTVKLSLPNRWGTSDKLSRDRISATEQDDQELRIINDKKWAYKKIYNGEFHTYFENKQTQEKKYFVPKEKRKGIFYATVNAMCASSMMNALKPGGRIPTTVVEYQNAINDALNTYKVKKDIHQPRKDANRYKQHKLSESKSYQDYMKEQTKHPIAVLFELTCHTVLSVLTIGTGITLDLMTDCQKTRGHLRFWDKVTDDINNTVNEVEENKNKLQMRM